MHAVTVISISTPGKAIGNAEGRGRGGVWWDYKSKPRISRGVGGGLIRKHLLWEGYGMMFSGTTQ